VCWYEQFDSVKWFSNDDQSHPDLGLTCVRVDQPPSGTSKSSWAQLWKLSRLIEQFPW
jgi:hypothetical protein